MDNNAQGWAHQLELEHRRFLEERALWERAMLKVDPAYSDWLSKLENEDAERINR